MTKMLNTTGVSSNDFFFFFFFLLDVDDDDDEKWLLDDDAADASFSALGAGRYDDMMVDSYNECYDFEL
jgi:hypothetical protein